MRFFVHGCGSNIPKVSYADAECTTPNTHPVIADANGKFPAMFFETADWYNTTDAEMLDSFGRVLCRFSPIGLGNAIKYRLPHDEPTSDLTRLKTIERAALALLKNKKDLGLVQLRQDLIEDLRKAVES